MQKEKERMSERGNQLHRRFNANTHTKQSITQHSTVQHNTTQRQINNKHLGEYRKHYQLLCKQQIHELITIILFSMKSIINIEYSINYWYWTNNRRYLWSTPFHSSLRPLPSLSSSATCLSRRFGSTHLDIYSKYSETCLSISIDVHCRNGFPINGKRCDYTSHAYKHIQRTKSINYSNCTQSIITQSSFILRIVRNIWLDKQQVNTNEASNKHTYINARLDCRVRDEIYFTISFWACYTAIDQ